MRIVLPPLLLLFLSGSASFLLGTWRIQGKPFPIITVLEDRIVSDNNAARISMTATSWRDTENKTTLIDLDHMVVEKRPRDWFNLSKYASFLKYYYTISNHGLHLRVGYVDANETMVDVECTSNGERLGRIRLVKEK